MSVTQSHRVEANRDLHTSSSAPHLSVSSSRTETAQRERLGSSVSTSKQLGNYTAAPSTCSPIFFLCCTPRVYVTCLFLNSLKTKYWLLSSICPYDLAVKLRLHGLKKTCACTYPEPDFCPLRAINMFTSTSCKFRCPIFPDFCFSFREPKCAKMPITTSR